MNHSLENIYSNQLFQETLIHLRTGKIMQIRTYPKLAVLAMIHLAIPASSAPVGRLFSIAGKSFVQINAMFLAKLLNHWCFLGLIWIDLIIHFIFVVFERRTNYRLSAILIPIRFQKALKIVLKYFPKVLVIVFVLVLKFFFSTCT